MQVTDLIYQAYRIAGVLQNSGRGVGTGTSEATDGFTWLNSMLDMWQTQRLMVYHIVRSVQPINAGQQVYIIGQNGTTDWPVPRPTIIERAGFIFNNVEPQIEQPIIIYNYQQWASLSPKDIQTDIVQFLYYEPTIPNGTVNVWPVPVNSWQIALYLWQNLQQFVTMNDTVTLPPGYQECIVYNLALRIAGLFPGRSAMDPDSKRIAADSYKWLKNQNDPGLLMQGEKASFSTTDAKGRYLILSNQWR